MPIGGHRPELRPFGLHLCASCRADDHTLCGRIRLRRVVLFCECPGFDLPPGQPFRLLLCVTKETPMTNGIDFAWHPALDYADVRRQGYTFVCRYLSHTDGKNLHPDEAKSWLAAGLSIVLVWESTSNRADAGHDAGVQDARDAAALAKSCGAPISTAIYFAVDEDTALTPAIAAYFQGAASVLGASRVGVYGGYRVVAAALNAGLVGYAWQTYAWSGGRWDSRVHLRQVHNGVTVSGISADLDTAGGDIGAWQPALPAPPAGHDRWLRLTDPPMRDLPNHHDVSDVQRALNLLPNNHLPLTGVYDRATADVVQVFQQHRSIPERGVGPLTWAALRAVAHQERP